MSDNAGWPQDSPNLGITPVDWLSLKGEVFGPCGNAMLARRPPPVGELHSHVGAGEPTWARYSYCRSMDVFVVTLSHGASELTEMPQVFSSHSGM